MLQPPFLLVLMCGYDWLCWYSAVSEKNIPRPRSSQKLRLVVSVSNVSLVEVTATEPSFFSCHLNMEHGHPDCSCKFIKQYSVKHANWQSPGATTTFPCFFCLRFWWWIWISWSVAIWMNSFSCVPCLLPLFGHNYNNLSRPYPLDWFSKANLQHIVWIFGLVNRNCAFLSGSNMDAWEMAGEFKGLKAPTPPAGYKTIRPYIKDH